MTLNFEKIFKPIVLASLLNRSHPSIRRDKKWFIQFSIAHGLYTLVFFLFIYNIKCALARNDFSAMCKHGCLSLVYLVITIAYSVMLVYQTKIKTLFKIVRRDFENFRGPEEAKIIAHFAREMHWICIQWILLPWVGWVIFPGKNLVLYIVYYYRNDEFKLIPMYDLKYPGVFEEHRDNIVIYLLFYLLLLFFATYSSVMYLAFVPQGPMFMVHACAKLEIIKTRMESLFDKFENEALDAELRSIIQQLQAIYSFVEDINLCFRIFYELTLKATAVILPITCYEVIESFHNGEVSLEFITFIVGSLFFSATPSYYSNLLMEKGEEFRQAVFACGWERHYDRRALRVRKTLLIILVRAVRPIAVRTMFRTLCLETLTDHYHQSYAIFNLMNAMWK